jgi:O-antigen/teichoic acid export membrane protein
MGSQSVLYLFLPQILNRIAFEPDLTKKSQIIKNVRYVYLNGISFILISIIFVFPLISPLLKDYNIDLIVTLLIISLLFRTRRFGYVHFMISYGKEKLISKITLISVFINFLIGGIVTYGFDFTYHALGYTTIFAMFLNSYLTIYYAKKKLHERRDFLLILKEALPIKFLITILLFVLAHYLEYWFIYYILGYFFYFISNYKTLIQIVKSSYNIVLNNKNYQVT